MSFKGHGGRAFHSIFISTSRAETAVAAEGDEFEFTAGRTAVHGPAKGRIATALTSYRYFPSQYFWDGEYIKFLHNGL